MGRRRSGEPPPGGDPRPPWIAFDPPATATLPAVNLADAPEDTLRVDAPTIALTPALLRGDARLVALFAPFRECVVLHEALTHDGAAARASRRLMAEVRADILDDVRALVRATCEKRAFEEKPTELDDVAAGTEWRERSGPLSISAYRLFGGSTALHAKVAKVDAPDAGLRAVAASPLAVLEDVVSATSYVDNVSCSRVANEAPRWHLQATLRDMRRFTEIVPRLEAAGFEERAGKHWRERIIVQPIGRDRWMAAFPGIDFGN